MKSHRASRAIVGAVMTLSLTGTAGPIRPFSAEATPRVSIKAKSALPVVSNDVWTLFSDKAYGKAEISGTVTGAPPKSKASLISQVFPFKNKPSVMASQALKASGAKSTYSFGVQPELATRYFVEILPPGGGKKLAHSPRLTIYVAAFGRLSTGAGVGRCQRPVCHQHFAVLMTWPASVAASDASKHMYEYFGLNLDTTGATVPATPRYLHLTTNWKVTRKRLSPDTYQFSISFSFTIGRHPFNWQADQCMKDTEANDGVGLPGRHGCGSTLIRTDAPYVG